MRWNVAINNKWQYSRLFATLLGIYKRLQAMPKNQCAQFMSLMQFISDVNNRKKSALKHAYALSKALSSSSPITFIKKACLMSCV